MDYVQPMGIPVQAEPKYKKLTISRHKQLTALSYEVYALMTKKLGKNKLEFDEICLFGHMMQNIIGIEGS